MGNTSSELVYVYAAYDLLDEAKRKIETFDTDYNIFGIKSDAEVGELIKLIEQSNCSKDNWKIKELKLKTKVRKFSEEELFQIHTRTSNMFLTLLSKLMELGYTDCVKSFFSHSSGLSVCLLYKLLLLVHQSKDKEYSTVLNKIMELVNPILQNQYRFLSESTGYGYDSYMYVHENNFVNMADEYSSLKKPQLVLGNNSLFQICKLAIVHEVPLLAKYFMGYTSRVLDQMLINDPETQSKYIFQYWNPQRMSHIEFCKFVETLSADEVRHICKTLPAYVFSDPSLSSSGNAVDKNEPKVTSTCVAVKNLSNQEKTSVFIETLQQMTAPTYVEEYGRVAAVMRMMVEKACVIPNCEKVLGQILATKEFYPYLDIQFLKSLKCTPSAKKLIVDQLAILEAEEEMLREQYVAKKQQVKNDKKKEVQEVIEGATVQANAPDLDFHDITVHQLDLHQLDQPGANDK
jgi:hypothetical protein